MKNVYFGRRPTAPGEKDTGRLEVGETRDGSTFGLPVAVVNGIDDGRTLYIQAASDGDELNGVGVIQRTLPQLDPMELSGRFCSVASSTTTRFRWPSTGIR